MVDSYYPVAALLLHLLIGKGQPLPLGTAIGVCVWVVFKVILMVSPSRRGAPLSPHHGIWLSCPRRPSSRSPAAATNVSEKQALGAVSKNEWGAKSSTWHRMLRETGATVLFQALGRLRTERRPQEHPLVAFPVRQFTQVYVCPILPTYFRTGLTITLSSTPPTIRSPSSFFCASFA